MSFNLRCYRLSGFWGFHLSRFPHDWRLLSGLGPVGGCVGRPPLVAAFCLRARDLLLASIALHIFPPCASGLAVVYPQVAGLGCPTLPNS